MAWVPADHPIYTAGWNFLAGANLNQRAIDGSDAKEDSND
jgi:hypothetical protein